jgi:hypothetical protein
MSGSNVRVVSVQCYGGIFYSDLLCVCAVHCREGNISNGTHIGTRHVILAKHSLWLPDDGLYKPKHVAAAFIILIILIIQKFNTICVP